MLKRVWTDLVEPVGKQEGKADGGGARKGWVSCRSHVAEEGRRLRCVGGVAEVAGRGRLVDGGGGGEWAVVEEGHSSRAVLTSAAGRRAAAATARRRLRPSGRAGRGWVGVVRVSCGLAAACRAGQRNGRAGVGVEQQRSKGKRHSKAQHAGSGQAARWRHSHAHVAG